MNQRRSVDASTLVAALVVLMVGLVTMSLENGCRSAVRRHNPDYDLFLKHWEIGKMPPTEREGLLFIDDSQILPSLDAMVDEFAEWGRAFAPAPVGFQYGYESDRPWWSKLDDPPGDVGRAILERVPNTEGLYWVDFTVLELFPPGSDEASARCPRICSS